MNYNSSFICKLCQKATKFDMVEAKEMMFGTREKFSYAYCRECNCLQLLDIPKDMEKYYSSKYYSFSHSNKLRNFLLKLQLKASFHRTGILFNIFNSYMLLNDAIFSISKINPLKNWKILDVGSGSGLLLHQLHSLGFTNVLGIDPHGDDITNSIRIKKTELKNLDENNFDLIMFHHSLEHMSNPMKVLLEAKKRLSPNGIILLRMPIVSYAFKKYGASWFQIDAPRHLFIFSPNGLKFLINQLGFELIDYYCDSNERQFICSEYYSRNIPMKEINENLFHKICSFFSLKRKYYRKQARKLNFNFDGDSGCFYLKSI